MNNGILWLESINFNSPVELKYNKAKHFHVTLQYDVDFEDVKHLVDQSVEFVAIENCWNDDIQALKVILPNTCLCNNKIPHITLSHKKGVSPVQSNNMFQNKHISEQIFEVITMTTQFYQFK